MSLNEIEVEVPEGKIIDPGSKEGIKKDPVKQQDNITEKSERFQDVYKNWKMAERRIEKLEKDAGNSGDNKDLIEEMRRHNSSLEETIKQISAKPEDTGEDALKDLGTKLGELKDLKRQSRENADFDSETKIDDSIADLKMDIRDLKKEIYDKKEKAKVKPLEEEKKESKLSEDDQADYDMWVSDNEWFTKDKKKRVSAIAFEKKIIKEEDFKDVSLIEVLEEVKVRVEEKFKTVKGVNTVEGDDHSGGHREVSGTVKLSKTELEIAKGLGLEPAAYAKQKSIISQGRKD